MIKGQLIYVCTSKADCREAAQIQSIEQSVSRCLVWSVDCPKPARLLTAHPPSSSALYSLTKNDQFQRNRSSLCRWRSAALSFHFGGLLDLLGLRDGVLPGVVLLSRRRRSGFPVDFAIGLGPGLSAMGALLFLFKTNPARNFCLFFRAGRYCVTIRTSYE